MSSTAQPGAITDKQQRVLNAVRSYWEERRQPPTIRELAARMGYEAANASAIRDHLRALKRKGFVEWEPRVARTLKLTAKAGEAREKVA